MDRDALRTEWGLTQPMLCLLTGFNQSTVNDWLRGTRVDPRTAARLQRCVEAARLARKGDLAAMRVEHVAFMGPVVTAFADAPVPAALRAMFEDGLSHAPVVDSGGDVVGWLDEDAIARRVVRGETKSLRGLRVRDVVDDWGPAEDWTIPAAMPLDEAAGRLSPGRALLVGEGRQRGILTSADLLKAVFLGLPAARRPRRPG